MVILAAMNNLYIMDIFLLILYIFISYLYANDYYYCCCYCNYNCYNCFDEYVWVDYVENMNDYFYMDTNINMNVNMVV